MWPNKESCLSPEIPAPVRIIYLKERNFRMLKKDLILRNPLRLVGCDEDILPKGGFGAVLARAGVGKTSLMVQLALNTLLRSKNVLHISLVDPVKKVDLWYEEVFKNISRLYNLKKTDELWDSILPHRFIMTFNVEGFSVPKLEERLSELTEQGIFFPDMILIDGLPFNETIRQPLSDLKILAKSYGQHVWFAVRTHRHEKTGSDGLPLPLMNVADFFDLVLYLQPKENEIRIKVLKGISPDSDHPALFLDPATMLIKDKE